MKQLQFIHLTRADNNYAYFFLMNANKIRNISYSDYCDIQEIQIAVDLGLIDYIGFYAIWAIFQPFSDGIE